MAKSLTLLDRGITQIKQQVELISVEIDVPGSFFSWSESSAAERRDKYRVQAYKKSTVRRGRAQKTLRPRIRLIQRKNLLRRRRERERGGSEV